MYIPFTIPRISISTTCTSSGRRRRHGFSGSFLVLSFFTWKLAIISFQKTWHLSHSGIAIIIWVRQFRQVRLKYHLFLCRTSLTFYLLLIFPLYCKYSFSGLWWHVSFGTRFIIPESYSAMTFIYCILLHKYQGSRHQDYTRYCYFYDTIGSWNTWLCVVVH